MYKKEKTACFSGHRIIAKEKLHKIEQQLDNIISDLIRQGIVFFETGGAIGFDQIAASVVIRRRELNSEVKLIMALPCRNQEVHWKDSEKQKYLQLLSDADKIIYVSERYFDGCMAKRNLYLVENSAICIAYMKHKRSGTGQTVRLARERGLQIINLAD